jgi:hypothetical protein
MLRYRITADDGGQSARRDRSPRTSPTGRRHRHDFPYNAPARIPYCADPDDADENRVGEAMDGGLLVLVLVGVGLLVLFVYVLLRMAGTQDRIARHAEKKLHPFSDVTITR